MAQDKRSLQCPPSREVYKLTEGKKDSIREKSWHKLNAGERLQVVAIFPLAADAQERDMQKVWRLAKRTARSYLHDAGTYSAVVTAHDDAAQPTIYVYGKTLCL